MEWLMDLIVERPAMFARIVLGIVVIMAAIISALFKKEKVTFTLRNQHDVIVDCKREDIYSWLDELYDDYDQFVIVEASKPIKKVKFMQVARINDELVDLQISCGELYHIEITLEESKEYFNRYISGSFKPDMNVFKKVEFL